MNQWIKTGGAFDGVLDFDKAVSDPAHVNLLYPPFNCDDIHPSPLGYFEMAKAVSLTTVRQYRGRDTVARLGGHHDEDHRCRPAGVS